MQNEGKVEQSPLAGQGFTAIHAETQSCAPASKVVDIANVCQTAISPSKGTRGAYLLDGCFQVARKFCRRWSTPAWGVVPLFKGRCTHIPLVPLF